MYCLENVFSMKASYHFLEDFDALLKTGDLRTGGTCERLGHPRRADDRVKNSSPYHQVKEKTTPTGQSPRRLHRYFLSTHLRFRSDRHQCTFIEGAPFQYIVSLP